MTDPTAADLMALAARRAESRPEYVASRLAAYRDRHGLTDADVAVRLGLTTDELVSLALCLMTAGTEETAIPTMAEWFGIDQERLAGVLAPAEEEGRDVSPQDG